MMRDLNLLLCLLAIGPAVITAANILKAPDCSLMRSQTILPDPTSCSHYYKCINGRAYRSRCTRGLYFDEDSQSCNFASSVQCVQMKRLAIRAAKALNRNPNLEKTVACEDAHTKTTTPQPCEPSTPKPSTGPTSTPCGGNITPSPSTEPTATGASTEPSTPQPSTGPTSTPCGGNITPSTPDDKTSPSSIPCGGVSKPTTTPCSTRPTTKCSKSTKTPSSTPCNTQTTTTCSAASAQAPASSRKKQLIGKISLIPDRAKQEANTKKKASAAFKSEICLGKPNGAFVRHPSSCAKFFICQHGVASQRRCPGTLKFDIKKMVCNFSYLVDCSD